MERQMDRDCETSAAVSQVHREIMYLIQRDSRGLMETGFIQMMGPSQGNVTQNPQNWWDPFKESS